MYIYIYAHVYHIWALRVFLLFCVCAYREMYMYKIINVYFTCAIIVLVERVIRVIYRCV